MKNLLATIALAATFCGLTARAQTYGSTTPITGGTNLALIQISPGTYFSNMFSAYLPMKTLSMYGISSTNEVIKAQFGIQIPNNWTLMTGSSNIYIFGAFTNSFGTGTNGGSWTTNGFYFNSTVQLPCYFNLDVGTNAAGNYNSNNAYMP